RSAAVVSGFKAERLSIFARKVMAPSGLRSSRTMCGLIQFPLLAKTEYAVAICKGVTPTSCPIASDPIDDGCQRLNARRMPGDSPARSIPVRDPNPSRFMYSYIDSLPTRRPSLIAPTLLDFARASATVSTPYG